MSRPVPPVPAEPGPRPRPAADPYVMSPGEQLMCEWEARHDVAARGSRALPGALQHYLAESHSREACDRAAQPPPSRPRRPSQAPAPAEHTPWWRRPAR